MNADFAAEKLHSPKSWPVTIVAMYFVLQGLSAGYSALAFVGLFGYPAPSGSMMGIAVPGAYATLYAIVSVSLFVSGAGLLARNRACLTIAVILAGLSLFSAGADAIGAFFGPSATPLGGLAAIVFVAIGCLQYAILRSKSTIALFDKPLDQ